MSNLNTRNVFSVSTTLLLSSLLTACGGGTSIDTTSNDVTTGVTTHPSEPIAIESTSWGESQARASLRDISIETAITRNRVGGQVSLDIKVKGVRSFQDANEHWQVFLDIDNDSTTGFQFDGEAWSRLSGVDYVIEDGHLYKSTANDSSWSWKWQKKLFTIGIGDLHTSVPLKPNNVMKGLCKQFNIGYVGRNENWQIEEFYPLANKMLAQTVSYCENPTVNQAPVVKLNGETPMTVEKGSLFVDPGATAFDREDGDVSSQIAVSIVKIGGTRSYPVSSVNTNSIGTYIMRYDVKDSGGLRAGISRKVIVKRTATGSITVDGNKDDWTVFPSTIDPHNNVSLSITEDDQNIYIMVEAEELGANTQVFIDSDNKMNTGYRYFDSNNSFITGAELMIENTHASSYAGTRYEWAWKESFRPNHVVRSESILEMSIAKTSLKHLVKGEKIRISFMSLDDNWTNRTGYQNNDITLTGNYTLKFHTMSHWTTSGFKNLNQDSNETGYHVKTTGNKFELWKLTGTSDKLVSTFDHKPEVLSTKGALYVVTKAPLPYDLSSPYKRHYLWKVNQTTATNKEIYSFDTNPPNGLIHTLYKYTDAYSVGTRDYVVRDGVTSSHNSTSTRLEYVRGHFANLLAVTYTFRGEVRTKTIIKYANKKLYFTTDTADSSQTYVKLVEESGNIRNLGALR